MVSRFRSWWQYIRKHRVAAIITAFVVVMVLIFAGYWLDWTGFNGGYNKVIIARTISGTNAGTVIRTEEHQPGKALWDWLQLLGVLAIPAVVGLGAAWYTGQQGKVSDRENTDNQRETALQKYIDNMSELLLHEKLRDSAEEDEVRKIARVRTLTILPRLDASRKRSVLQFLHESGLIIKDRKIIDVSGADLRGADLIYANLSDANLSDANLSDANLSDANLRGAHLIEADLSWADLSWADLSWADLSNADLSGANLSDADLSGANLRGANLRGANLSDAALRGANLSDANLTGARSITIEELEKQAKSLQGATMPDGSKHP